MHVQVYVVVPAQKMFVMQVRIHVDEQDIRRTNYVCNANICTVKLKSFLRRESARVRSLNLYPPGEPEGNEKNEPLEKRSMTRRTTPCQVRILAQTVSTPEFLTPRRQFEQERE